MDKTGIFTKLTGITVLLVSIIAGFPLILMVIDAALNREDCLIVRLWDIIIER